MTESTEAPDPRSGEARRAFGKALTGGKKVVVVKAERHPNGVSSDFGGAFLINVIVVGLAGDGKFQTDTPVTTLRVGRGEAIELLGADKRAVNRAIKALKA